MTPDQIAEFCGHAGRKSEGFDCICGLLERFGRAALRERDAAWKDALQSYSPRVPLEELFCHACLTGGHKMMRCVCAQGAALRALLEEAGK